MTRWFGLFLATAVWAAPSALAWEAAAEFSDCSKCPVMVVVPAGTFTMGSPVNEDLRAADEGPQHKVAISNTFAVGKFEVTRGQYADFMAETDRDPGDNCYVWRDSKYVRDVAANWSNPGFEQGDQEPVVCISWEDAQAYAAWLSNKTAMTYRLLTEAEWEYAARGGSTTAFSFGDTITTSQVNFKGNEDGDAADVFREKTVEVGSFLPNNFGLYDMHGNATEWIEDCWNDAYDDGPSNEAARLSGDCDRRMLRGGSWQDLPMHVRAADRLRYNLGSRNSYMGFRIARTLD